MSGPFGSSPWGYNPGGDFYSHSINQSLRFEDGDNPYLNKTLSGSGGTIFTFSCWVKLGNLSINRCLLQGYADASNFAQIVLYSNNVVGIYSTTSGTARLYTYTTALQRDPSAWYHIVVKFNGTSGSEEFKIYINGVDQALTTTTALSAHQSSIGNSNAHYIGNNFNQSLDMDGYMAEVNFIDGTALDASSFGETKDGIWIPKNTSGLTFGNNGFRLDFADSSDIGNDVSGNNNDFTTNNLAATDVVLDSPTNNWCELNPLSKGSGTITFSEGNLKSSTSANLAPSEHGATFTIPKSGKWYWEAAYTGALTNGGQATMMGIMDIDTQTVGLSGNHLNNTTGDYITYYSHNSGVYENNTLDSSFSGNEAAATVGFALDMDNGYLFIHLNGTYIGGTPNFSTGANHAAEPNITRTWLPFFGASGGGAITWRANFGQDSAGISSAQSPDNGIGTFEYDVPADYKALCSQNLPEPEIIDGSENFNTVLWTGNGSDGRSITGVGFDPNFVWIKSRNLATSHLLNDTVRGANKSLFSEGGTEETPNNGGGYLSAFVTDGFSVTSGSSGDDAVNDSSDTYVSWNWKAGTAFSNSAGANGASIASSGQVDTKAGFSIVSYTGSGSNATVAHGLGVAPSMVIIKARDDTTGDGNWLVYAKAGTVDETDYLLLNSSTKAEDEAGAFNDTAATTTTFSVGTFVDLNQSSITYIAYCFANIEGYCKVGSYLGNDDPDGTFVYTGFRPAWVMIKKYNLAGQWWGIYDSARDPENLVQQRLWANEVTIESAYSTDELDFLSNGFKPRGNYDSINGSGSSYLYLAFAESPFKYANAR